jgi:hypothetical protein
MIRSSEVKVTLSGFGRTTTVLTFDEKPTVAEAINKAGWTLSSTEKPAFNGEACEMADLLEDGDTIQIVGKKEGGRK